MNKLECIENYYSGTRAFYLNFIGDMESDSNLKKYITDDNNILSSKVSLISLLMFMIKEGIVENSGNLKYNSLVFENSMEASIKYITTKEKDKYYIDGYEFDNPSNIVALIRNKLGHGEYYIDYENNSVVFLYNDNKIKVHINHLVKFIISSLKDYLVNKKTNTYTKGLCINNKVKIDKINSLNTTFELKNIIRGLSYYKLTLSTKEEFLPEICIKEFDEFSKNYEIGLKINKHNELVENYNKFIKEFGCNLSVEVKKKLSNEAEDRLINYGKYLSNSFSNMTYDIQVYMIAVEALKYFNEEEKEIEFFITIMSLLNLLDTIKSTKSSDSNIITSYLESNKQDGIIVNYNGIGTVLISMFNSLFIYPFEDVYTNNIKYKLDKTGELDFSILDFDLIKPIIDGIDRRPIEIKEDQVRVLENEFNKIKAAINEKNKQLSNVKGNTNIEELLKNNINKLNIELQKVNINLIAKRNECFEIKEDYRINHKYFKNKAIINGIRNSIAHGHYEIIPAELLADTKIIFTDLYEGKETFKVEINFEDFSGILENNFKVMLDYVNKNKSIKKKTL